MGWGTGSRVFSELIDVIVEVDVDDLKREYLYQQLIDLFERYDCDTLDECLGTDPIFDLVWNERNPDMDDEEFPDD